jgi:hypothetical protein
VVLGLGAYAEAHRGLFFALTDVVRILLALVAGFVAYALAHGLGASYVV